jgi:hypothetical protein
MLTLLGVALFCLLTGLGTPDKSFLTPESTFRIPFAEAPISFLGFIVVSPLLLIVIAIYLHIFFGYWQDLERERRQINKELAIPSEKRVESVPSLFAFTDPMSRFLTTFVFYWLIPLVLAGITWKAAARPPFGPILVGITGLVTFALVFLRIRRCPDSQRRWRNPPRWAVLCVMVALLGLAAWDIAKGRGTLHRPLHLSRVDLKEAWLRGVDMHDAVMDFVQLQKADLRHANLTGANLTEANLTEANLRRANLTGADFGEANLTGADFGEANLTGANLQRADLTGADFGEANLTGALLQATILLKARNLRPSEIKRAKGWDWAIYDGDFLQQLGLPPDNNEKVAKKLGVPFPR